MVEIRREREDLVFEYVRKLQVQEKDEQLLPEETKSKEIVSIVVD